MNPDQRIQIRIHGSGLLSYMKMDRVRISLTPLGERIRRYLQQIITDGKDQITGHVEHIGSRKYLSDPVCISTKGT